MEILSSSHSRHTSLIHQPSEFAKPIHVAVESRQLSYPSSYPIRFFNLLKKFQVLFGLDSSRINISSGPLSSSASRNFSLPSLSGWNFLTFIREKKLCFREHRRPLIHRRHRSFIDFSASLDVWRIFIFFSTDSCRKALGLCSLKSTEKGSSVRSHGVE